MASTQRLRHSWTKTVEDYLPSVLGGALYLSAFFSFLLLFASSTRGWLGETINTVVFALSFLGLPVASSLLNIAVTGLAATMAVRRKRVVWWGFFTYQSLILLANVVIYIDDGYQDSFNLWSAFTNLIVLLLLVVGRRAFPGKIGKGSIFGALAIFVGGLLIVFQIGFLIARLLRPEIPYERIVLWVTYRLFGAEYFSLWEGPVPHSPNPLGLGISLAGVVVLVSALLYFFRSYRAVGTTREEDLRVRRLINEFPEDSLSYYATRAERSVVFSPNGRAAVSYALSSGAAIAAADPIGDPQYWHEAIREWVKLCYRSGWALGVLSASESGARAYQQAGFHFHAMGDEAIVYPDRFNFSAQQMRGLSKSVRRVRRHGIRIEVRRMNQIPAPELRELRQAAELYRNGDERGFTMSLDRILDIEDGRTMVVTAREGDTLHALLTFVPWGANGLSLSLMRRNPRSVNGVIEAMVVHLIESAKDISITRISLNFAMFRHAFVAGESVTANLFHRLVLTLMRFGSRFWQLESLYESNARYQPEWFPRYMGVRHSSQTLSVLLACGRLEGFLPRFGFAQAEGRLWQVDEEYLTEVRQIEQPDPSVVADSLRLSEQERVRRSKARRLERKGREIYPAGVEAGEPLSVVRELAIRCTTGQVSSAQVVTSGRIRVIRNLGGIIFTEIYSDGEKLQLMIERDQLPEADFQDFSCLDLGDMVRITGVPARSRRGEPSVQVKSWQLLAKSLRPWPATHQVLDAATRMRERALHLAHTPDALELIKMRSRAVRAVRTELDAEGFLEVETPILQSVKGGANARPFVTYLRAYGSDVFLRIAPELYLKQLAVAGMGAIFELGRSFRNEGADATHNPEFTSLEAYRAGADYHDMRLLTQRLFQAAARAVHGQEICLRPRSESDFGKLPVARTVEGVEMVAFDISGDWPVVPVLSAVSAACGYEITTEISAERLVEICREYQIEVPAVAEPGELITALYDELVEARTVAPTFYTDFPVSTSPLTRRSRRDPALAERWDLVAFGMELGTAYTELTDPRDQRERFVQQSLVAAAGDPEAMSVDEGFLSALELGMPPTGGLGLGIDRMIMLLTGTNIRQTLAFPFVRPRSE
ncbi:bifunctional lysylphosphatidylglycerol synthetase/lysine--tRNA ligase LysX [Boudabousia marimammalium]|uniref:Lysine--tRNA ligase n=1 Tax=Boudabousia marimammalium TaxID=156892 RepID=A0A1Q5PP31_9ACTO|nr:bifunctional lysylphosphatidylglycerol synthetase/lysine--tRNA ligase LysX [Boudabousia marimammalium]OKL49269.1 lysine--tRNA ligase [Boudabousia marimammalium]